MKMLIWLLLFSCASTYAHMPTSTCDVTYDEQSLASYIYVDGEKECEIDVHHDDEKFGVTVGVPFHIENSVEVIFEGFGACDEDWTGHDGDEYYYEPFGVGAYKHIAACKAELNGSHVHVDIKTNESTPVSLGIGSIEYFSAEQLIFMSLSIAETWVWMGTGTEFMWNYTWIPISAVLSISFVLICISTILPSAPIIVVWID